MSDVKNNEIPIEENLYQEVIIDTTEDCQSEENVEVIADDSQLQSDAIKLNADHQTEEIVNDESTSEVIDMAYIADLFNKLSEKFDKKIAADEHKNLLFDKMYAELELYKKDLQAKLLKPFIMETIMLIEDTARFIDKIETLESDKVITYVKGIPDDLINILDMSDVEQYEDESTMFNPRTQKVAKQIETAEQEQNNMIESRIRKGYRWNGVVIRPEVVQVYKFKESK